MENQLILGREFVKYEQTSDNTYEINEVVSVSDGMLNQLVNNYIERDKVIAIYDCHRPKETRQVVGEVVSLTSSNEGILAKIKWNDLGTVILENQTRYPSVELNVDKKGEYFIFAVAMVCEPASEEVKELELSSIQYEDLKEVTMDEAIRKIVEENINDKEAMKEKLLEIATADPSTLAIIMDILTDEMPKVEVKEEVKEEEMLESEEERKEDDIIDDKEDIEDDEEDLARDLESSEKKDEELTSIAMELGARGYLGVPTAGSLTKAIKHYRQHLVGGYEEKEAFEKFQTSLSFIGGSKGREVTAIELDSYAGKKEVSQGEKAYNFFNNPQGGR